MFDRTVRIAIRVAHGWPITGRGAVARGSQRFPPDGLQIKIIPAGPACQPSFQSRPRNRSPARPLLRRLRATATAAMAGIPFALVASQADLQLLLALAEPRDFAVTTIYPVREAPLFPALVMDLLEAGGLGLRKPCSDPPRRHLRRHAREARGRRLPSPPRRSPRPRRATQAQVLRPRRPQGPPKLGRRRRRSLHHGGKAFQLP